jgi:hypothetical protein
VRAADSVLALTIKAMEVDDIEPRLADLERARRKTNRRPELTNLRRRLGKLESQLIDGPGLVPHSRKWLEYLGAVA